MGADGETHQGILDLSYLCSIPGMNVFAPKNKYELYDVLKFSRTFDAPLAIRYPRGTAYGGLKQFRAPIEYGKSEILRTGARVAILAVGSMVGDGLGRLRPAGRRKYRSGPGQCPLCQTSGQENP